MTETSVQTFKAGSMQEALDIVRREMGPDAVILHTREIPQSRFLPWRRGKNTVEITAGLGVNVRTPKARLQAASNTLAQHEATARKLVEPPVAPAAGPHFNAANGPASSGSMPASNGTARQVDPLLAPAPQLTNTYTRPSQHVAPAALGRAPAAGHAGSFGGAGNGATPAHNAHSLGQDYGGLAATARPQPRVEAPSRSFNSPAEMLLAESLWGTANAGPLAHDQQSVITQQLSSIQKMVEKLSHGALSRNEEIPGELFQMYTRLIDAEVDEDLARQLICRLKQECGAEDLNHPAFVKARLRDIVEAEIRCAPPISALPNRRKVVALVGPTGVGKTTTIAKLAANFRLRDGIRMGLVTVDTYRIAAVEQLRTYAEIIDLPMKVVTGPREMRRALDELAGLDLVLIDTAGRSPRDELKIQELKTLLLEAQVDEVHLVLSLTASARSLEATAEKFAAAGTTAMVLTKLDEAVGMGALMSVTRKIPLPISYLTTGQDVPDDIEHAKVNRIARLVLGEEGLFAQRRSAA